MTSPRERRSWALSKASRDQGPRHRQVESAIGRARLALAWEELWPRLAPLLTVAGLFVALSWLGVWRIGGEDTRLVLLASFGLALLGSILPLVRFRRPSRHDAIRRVELRSGVPHRPLRSLADRLSPVAGDRTASALWAAEQARIAASLHSLKAGTPKPGLIRRDRHGFRFAVPVLLGLAFAVGWGEWAPRLGEAFRPAGAAARPIAARLDVWIDPPAYTGAPPVFLSRLDPAAAAAPVAVPEGSRLSARIVAREPASVTFRNEDGGATAIGAAATPAPPPDAKPPEQSPRPGSPPAADAAGLDGQHIQSFEAALDRSGTLTLEADRISQSYRIDVVEDRPPTVSRGPLTVNRAGSFTIDYPVADDYGVTEGSVTFQPVASPAAEGSPAARPLFEPPSLPIRIDRATARDGTARATGRLDSHPLAGSDVRAEVVVKDAAGQEGRPVDATADAGLMTLPARPFYNPLARALVEQRRILALDANRRGDVQAALDALTVAPDRLGDSGAYLGLRVAYGRLANARDDDELRAVVDLLWDMAREIEDGEVADAEARLAKARDALQQALKDGAPKEEIARLTEDLREAMRDFMESFAKEMAKRGPQPPTSAPDQQAQTLSEQDLQNLLDQVEKLAQLGENEAAQQLLSELQQMLDNLQMAQPGDMQPGDREAMQQMDELADIMRRQQQLMDDTFQLNQGHRPGEQSRSDGSGADGEQPGDSEPMTPEELEQLAEQLRQKQNELTRKLQKLLEEMAGKQDGQNGQSAQGGKGEPGGDEGGEPGSGDRGRDGDGPNGDGEGQGGQALGRAGRAMGDASRALGAPDPGAAYGHQGEALQALRDGMRGMMQQMFASQPGQPGNRPGQQRGRGGNDQGNDDPLGRPQRRDGPDLGQSVKVPDEIDVERARRILDAIRGRLGERTRPRYELDYLERLLAPD